MSTKRIEVDLSPGFVVPAVVLLYVVSMVVPIYVIADAFIILTGDGETVDVDGDLLVKTMINFGRSTETAMFAVSGGKEISVDVETSSKRKFIVR
jgi:hypothetical protein